MKGRTDNPHQDLIFTSLSCPAGLETSTSLLRLVILIIYHNICVWNKLAYDFANEMKASGYALIQFTQDTSLTSLLGIIQETDSSVGCQSSVESVFVGTTISLDQFSSTWVFLYALCQYLVLSACFEVMSIAFRILWRKAFGIGEQGGHASLVVFFTLGKLLLAWVEKNMCLVGVLTLKFVVLRQAWPFDEWTV